MLWIFVRIASVRRFWQISTTYVSWNVEYITLFNFSNNSFHIELKIRSIQTVVLTSFVVISNVGIKRVDCTRARADENLLYRLLIDKSQWHYNKTVTFKKGKRWLKSSKSNKTEKTCLGELRTHNAVHNFKNLKTCAPKTILWYHTQSRSHVLRIKMTVNTWAQRRHRLAFSLIAFGENKADILALVKEWKHCSNCAYRLRKMCNVMRQILFWSDWYL